MWRPPSGSYLASSMSESEESVREGRTLRSGKFVAFAVETEEIQVEMSEEDTDSAVKSVEELQAQVDELQQKLTMAESAIDDRDGELRAAQDALKRAKEDAESDLRRIDKEKKELISKHEKTLGELEDTVSRQDETIKTLEDHLAECKQLLEKQEVQLELARLQALETLREKFDKERETYLDRIQRLEKELESARRKAVGPSTTSPKEPETRKRDDAATSRKGVIPRVERLDTYAVDINPLPGSPFLVPLGQTVKLYCICNGYTMVQLLHNDSVVRSRPSCSIILHIVHNVSYSDEGRYTCRALDASNHTCDRPLGNLSAIDPDVVVAESRQYGILNANSSLNCTSTLDVFQDMIVYKWFRGSGKDRVRLEGHPEFVNTNYSHQGIYTCEVYISSVDIKIEKIVEFRVTDPPTTETPPTNKTPPKNKTPPSSGTPPTFITLTSVNITSQEVSSDSPMTGISKPLLNASLLLTIAMLLGT